jgi:hypothetical protein
MKHPISVSTKPAAGQTYCSFSSSQLDEAKLYLEHLNNCLEIVDIETIGDVIEDHC